MDERAVIDATRDWVARVVVGLGLCPFARRPVEADRVRYAATPAADPEDLRAALADELRLLAATPPDRVETTLLVHPHVLADFLDYNDFLAEADRLVSGLGLRGVVQLVGFHPGYRFAGAAPDAAGNYTNRSPYPTIHLLREASVAAVAGDPDALLNIPRRNVAALEALGPAAVRALVRAAGPGR